MASSQNGWLALEDYGHSLLHQWRIPARNGLITVTLRNGSAGFLLSHFSMWFSEAIEDVTGKILDDWGYAPRPIRGSTTTLSNHASGTAVDLNALQHPLGVKGTLTPEERAKIAKKLRQYDGCIRAGVFYDGRVDEMHFEIDQPIAAVEKVARRLAKTPRGDRILKQNRGQRRVINS
jgi:hypothetical protein